MRYHLVGEAAEACEGDREVCSAAVAGARAVEGQVLEDRELGECKRKPCAAVGAADVVLIRCQHAQRTEPAERPSQRRVAGCADGVVRQVELLAIGW